MYDLPVAAATITRRPFKKHSVIYLNGHFDFANIADVETLLRDYVAASSIVSLERVTFADCSLISALIRLQHVAQDKLIVIVPPSLPSARVFALMKAETFLRVVPHRPAALRLAAELATGAARSTPRC